jgi:hypothetical protein
MLAVLPKRREQEVNGLVNTGSRKRTGNEYANNGEQTNYWSDPSPELAHPACRLALVRA